MKTRESINAIIKCIDDQRAKGNKAFTTDADKSNASNKHNKSYGSQSTSTR